MNKVGVPGNFTIQKDVSAKKFALVKDYKMKSFANVSALCAEIFELEQRGEYQEGAKLLRPYWDGDKKVNLEGLTMPESANLLLRLGSVVSALGGFKQLSDSQDLALEFLEHAEHIFADISDSEGLSRCSYKKAFAFFRLGKLSETRNCLEAAFEKAVSADSKAAALCLFGTLEWKNFKYRTALDYYQRAFSHIDEINLLNQGNIHNGIGIVLDLLGRKEKGKKAFHYFDKAVIEFEAALHCYDLIGNKRYAVSTRNNVGFLYYSIKQYEDAQRVLNTAKTQAYQLRDDINIAIISDTLAQVFIATGDYDSAEANAAIAVEHFKENSYELSASLMTYGVALARGGKVNDAKSAFSESEITAEALGDSRLAAQARLFALRELFDVYEKPERQSIYDELVEAFKDTEDSIIIDSLSRISEQFTAPVAPRKTLVKAPQVTPVSTANTESPVVIKPFSLDRKLKEIERQFFEQAISQVKGNQSQAADLLGLSRQTFCARIKKDFPELVQKIKHIGKSKSKLRIFPTHSIVGLPEMPTKLGKIILEDDFACCGAGDILIIALDVWHLDRIIAVRNLFGEEMPVLIGYLRKKGESFALEPKDKNLILLNDDEMKLIIGEAIGFCKAQEYEEYINRRAKGEMLDLPLRLLSEE
jgi:tetratricopeptide (TPR) repeat protein